MRVNLGSEIMKGKETSTINQIFILGAGAVGSMCGAKLYTKNDVTLIGSDRHVEVIHKSGLRVKGEMEAVLQTKADTQIREIPPNSLVLLTTKVYDSKRALESIVKLLRDDTIIVILQNGIGNEEIAKEVVRDKIHIERGVLHVGVEFTKPGEVNITSSGWIALGNTQEARKIAKLFNESGLDTRIVDDLNKDVWDKLVINCVINSLSAIFEIRTNEVGTPALDNLRHGIVEECLKVAEAEGVHFGKDFFKEVDKRILKSKNYSSLYQDLMKDRKTEIDFLNGKIVELGRKHGIATPINEALVCMVKYLEETHARRVAHVRPC